MKLLLLFLLLQVSQHALFAVVTVKEGQTVVLPCQVGQVDQDSTVEWRCDKFNPPFVLVWRQGSELSDTQNLRYRGRVKLQDDFLLTRRLDLTLTDTNLSDGGNYTCSLRNAQQRLMETVQLQVTEKPSGLTSGEVAGVVIGLIATLIVGLFIGFVIGRRWKPAK